MTLEQFHAQLVKRRTEIEAGTFDSPPADFAAFQRRLGQHEEVNRLITDIETALKGSEDDKS